MLSKRTTKSYILVLIGLLFINSSCGSHAKLIEHWSEQKAPSKFQARFETTRGNFEIEAQRTWSPRAVDRLYQLIQSDFFSDVAIFRVVPDYVAQFGIHNNKKLNKAWNARSVADEPVLKKNLEGTLAFARSGKETRTSQLFINLKNNSPRLDTIMYNDVKGFPVIAKIIHGMDIVKQFYEGYAEAPAKQQGLIQKKGNAYLNKEFPKLDYIKKAYILK